MKKFIIFPSKEDFEKMKKNTIKRKKFNHPNILSLEAIEYNEEELTITTLANYPNADIYDQENKLKKIEEII